MKKMINAIREIQLKCLGGVEEETWAEREEEGEKEGKTRINLQAEETRDSSWLPRDTFGFISNLITSRGWCKI